MVNYICVVKSFFIAFFGSGLATTFVIFIAKQYIEKGIQHRFDVNLEKIKDQLKSSSDFRLEGAKNQFVIGATSHMANRVFDKHVEFCEAYVLEMQKALSVLVHHGPSVKLKENAERLKEIRLMARVWLPETIFDQLGDYERVLVVLALHAEHSKDGEYSGQPWYSQQASTVEKLFAEIIEEGGSPRNEEDAPPSRGTSTLITELKKVLGIEDLTRLRSALIQRASLD